MRKWLKEFNPILFAIITLEAKEVVSYCCNSGHASVTVNKITLVTLTLMAPKLWEIRSMSLFKFIDIVISTCEFSTNHFL